MRILIIPARALLWIPLLLLLGAPLKAQLGPLTGTITGVVVDEGGGPIAGAYVVADRLEPATRFSQASTPGTGSAFQVNGLPPGTYRLCLQDPTGGHLDPCFWSATPTTVTLAAGGTSAGNLIVFKKASKLQIRIEDPRHLLSPGSSLLEPPPEIVFAVGTPAGARYPAVLASTDPSGRTYRVPVPFDLSLALTLSAKHLVLVDDKGFGLHNGAANLGFQHTTGAAFQKSFTFTVLGRTN